MGFIRKAIRKYEHEKVEKEHEEHLKWMEKHKKILEEEKQSLFETRVMRINSMHGDLSEVWKNESRVQNYLGNEEKSIAANIVANAISLRDDVPNFYDKYIEDFLKDDGEVRERFEKELLAFEKICLKFACRPEIIEKYKEKYALEPVTEKEYLKITDYEKYYETYEKEEEEKLDPAVAFARSMARILPAYGAKDDVLNQYFTYEATAEDEEKFKEIEYLLEDPDFKKYQHIMHDFYLNFIDYYNYLFTMNKALRIKAERTGKGRKRVLNDLIRLAFVVMCSDAKKEKFMNLLTEAGYDAQKCYDELVAPYLNPSTEDLKEIFCESHLSDEENEKKLIEGQKKLEEKKQWAIKADADFNKLRKKV